MRVIVNFLFLLNIFSSSFAYLPRDFKPVIVPESRIVGGHIASPGQFPYQVGLHIKVTNITNVGTCGGSLISENYVLTAAHCVEVPQIEYMGVHLGAHELENPNEGHLVLIVPKENFISHKDYNHVTIENDISLLKLPESVKFTDRIQPISLPSKSDVQLNLEGKCLIASGWGRYSDDFPNLSQYLQYADLCVIHQRICEHYFRRNLVPSMICTDSGVRKGTCNSDSGGPLAHTDVNTRRTILIGITSFGDRTCIKSGWPAVYTRVTSFLDWIAANSDIKIQP